MIPRNCIKHAKGVRMVFDNTAGKCNSKTYYALSENTERRLGKPSTIILVACLLNKSHCLAERQRAVLFYKRTCVPAGNNNMLA